MDKSFNTSVQSFETTNALQDTTKSFNTVSLQNVDSLFRMAEIKRKQVDSVKKSIQLRAMQRLEMSKPVQVAYDSIPPAKITLNKEATASVFFPESYIPSLLSDSVYICDSEAYKSLAAKNSQVLVETVASTKRASVDIAESPVAEFYLPNWLFALAFSLLVIFAFIRVMYWKYVVGIFEGVVYSYAGEKLFRDKNIPFLRLSSVLDLLFFGSSSIIVYLYAKAVNFRIDNVDFNLFYFGLILGIILLFRLLRLIVHRFLAVATNSRSFFLEIYHHSLLYPRALAIISVPMAFFIAYSSKEVSAFLFYTYAVIVLVTLLFRLFRFAVVFLKKGFSLFYFLLYLCALEIPPVLILWKELFG